MTPTCWICGAVLDAGVTREGQTLDEALPRSLFDSMFVFTWHKTTTAHHHFLRPKN